MNETTNIFPLRQPDAIDDPLTHILRAGARQLLAQSVEVEVEYYGDSAGLCITVTVHSIWLIAAIN
jgi:hypothetical protein